MKKLFAYWMMLIILFVGIISINMQNSTKLQIQPGLSQQQNAVDLQSDTQGIQASGNFWLHHESNQVRSVDFSGSNVMRLIPDTAALRVVWHKQLTLQQLYSTNITLNKLLSIRQSACYYLFFLCKLLI